MYSDRKKLWKSCNFKHNYDICQKKQNKKKQTTKVHAAKQHILFCLKLINSEVTYEH